ncbi:hypothetical protein JOQ06_012288 [Pogonophryne albipinna]|uniref:Uncharacterized protein n=1 Tax=Pogonophryne albipinna TaxID=1090488 RepID=A0AAD6BGH4_9TELE|nr:hypothetical protein JOQ06_012288 [Pogonophryne albipinna]
MVSRPEVKFDLNAKIQNSKGITIVLLKTHPPHILSPARNTAGDEFACHGVVMNGRKAEEMYCGLIGSGKVKSGLAACPRLASHHGCDPPQMSRCTFTYRQPAHQSAAGTVATFHPQRDPHHTSSIFSCNHVTMQMLCTERFMLPSLGHHFQLPEPLS